MAQEFLGALRVSVYPVTDSLERHLFARNDVTVDENPAERDEWVTIMSIVVDAQHGSVFEAHARRSLDLDRQSVRLILDPTDLEVFAVESAIENFAAIVVRDQRAIIRPPQ